MKKSQIGIASLALLMGMASCSGSTTETLTSPDGDISLTFSLSKDGAPTYKVDFNGKSVIKPSTLGFELVDAPALLDGFKLDSVSHGSFDETWAPVWGESDSIRNHYNDMTVYLSQANGEEKRLMNIAFRAYDEGVAFRYIFPEQPSLKHFTIKEEQSQFALTGNHTAWWIPGDYDTQEYDYTESRLGDIRLIQDSLSVYNMDRQPFSPTGVQTSIQMKTDDGIYINLHEGALIDYPAMHLNLNDTTMTFSSWLTPGMNGVKAVIDTPFKTPWRTIMITDKATDILASRFIYNLNDPCALEDVSWIHPTKYMGVWWEMITNKSSWSYTDTENFDLATFDYSKAKPNGRHGANNANVRRYIDFAAENGFDQLLVEGWNIGWEDWSGKEKDYVFDFQTPYPDFDLDALNKYANSKGIKLMMHHETSSSVANYEKFIDAAYDLMNRYGYDAVKSGYVGKIQPKGDTHYSQAMVRHYLNAVKKAADMHIMVNGHEAVRPTGRARTYPNLVGNESARGTEYQAFGGLKPSHVTVLPFTRLQGGPMDYTPGIFKMNISEFVPTNKSHVNATIANQLALYLTMYSPLQMAADFPEHYAAKMDAFQFIKDVPVDWSESRYIDAEPGQFIVVARKDKNSDNWFAGGVTNEDARDFTLNLDFLASGKKYQATIYADAPDAHFATNPEAYVITSQTVQSTDSLPIHMAPGGGFAVSFKLIE